MWQLYDRDENPDEHASIVQQARLKIPSVEKSRHAQLETNDERP